MRHLYTKAIVLPRQARDKHRESTQKREFPYIGGKLLGGGGNAAASHKAVTAPCDASADQQWTFGATGSKYHPLRSTLISKSSILIV